MMLWSICTIDENSEGISLLEIQSASNAEDLNLEEARQGNESDGELAIFGPTYEIAFLSSIERAIERGHTRGGWIWRRDGEEEAWWFSYHWPQAKVLLLVRGSGYLGTAEDWLARIGQIEEG